MQDAPGAITIVDQIESEDIGGFVEVELIRDDEHGVPRVVSRSISHNLIVNTGKAQLWRLAMGLSAKLFDQGRVGTSAAAPASADTNVKSPVTGPVTVDVLTVDTGRTFKWIWSYPSGAGSLSAVGISEACILDENTAPGGNALMRSIFTPKTKGLADKLKLTYRARVA